MNENLRHGNGARPASAAGRDLGLWIWRRSTSPGLIATAGWELARRQDRLRRARLPLLDDWRRRWATADAAPWSTELPLRAWPRVTAVGAPAALRSPGQRAGAATRPVVPARRLKRAGGTGGSLSMSLMRRHLAGPDSAGADTLSRPLDRRVEPPLRLQPSSTATGVVVAPEAEEPLRRRPAAEEAKTAPRAGSRPQTVPAADARGPEVRRRIDGSAPPPLVQAPLGQAPEAADAAAAGRSGSGGHDRRVTPGPPAQTTAAGETADGGRRSSSAGSRTAPAREVGRAILRRQAGPGVLPLAATRNRSYPRASGQSATGGSITHVSGSAADGPRPSLGTAGAPAATRDSKAAPADAGAAGESPRRDAAPRAAVGAERELGPAIRRRPGGMGNLPLVASAAAGPASGRSTSGGPAPGGAPNREGPFAVARAEAGVIVRPGGPSKLPRSPGTLAGSSGPADHSVGARALVGVERQEGVMIRRRELSTEPLPLATLGGPRPAAAGWSPVGGGNREPPAANLVMSLLWRHLAAPARGRLRRSGASRWAPPEPWRTGLPLAPPGGGEAATPTSAGARRTAAGPPAVHRLRLARPVVQRQRAAVAETGAPLLLRAGEETGGGPQAPPPAGKPGLELPAPVATSEERPGIAAAAALDQLVERVLDELTQRLAAERERKGF